MCPSNLLLSIILGAALGYSAVFVFFLIKAPYKMNKEQREKIQQLEKELNLALDKIHRLRIINAKKGMWGE